MASRDYIEAKEYTTAENLIYVGTLKYTIVGECFPDKSDVVDNTFLDIALDREFLQSKEFQNLVKWIWRIPHFAEKNIVSYPVYIQVGTSEDMDAEVRLITEIKLAVDNRINSDTFNRLVRLNVKIDKQFKCTHPFLSKVFLTYDTIFSHWHKNIYED